MPDRVVEQQLNRPAGNVLGLNESWLSCQKGYLFGCMIDLLSMPGRIVRSLRDSNDIH